LADFENGQKRQVYCGIFVFNQDCNIYTFNLADFTGNGDFIVDKY